MSTGPIKIPRSAYFCLKESVYDSEHFLSLQRSKWIEIWVRHVVDTCVCLFVHDLYGTDSPLLCLVNERSSL